MFLCVSKKAYELVMCFNWKENTNEITQGIETEITQTLGSFVFGGCRFLTGSRILQSGPAQVKSQMQVASLLPHL